MVMCNRKLNRLKNYDYTNNGYYFVTICTKYHVSYFGKIIDGRMILNPNGDIMNHCWLDLLNHYPNCQLDEYIIMPNHFHGIIIIDNDNVGNGLKPFPTKEQHGLSEFIRAFKTFSSRRINERYPIKRFQWQKSFHDHIIRNNKSLHQIRRYIIENPIEWDRDEYNPI